MRRPLAALLVALALAGCGGEDGESTRRPRPPAPITVTAAIKDDRVSVSPARFGAGPVVVLVSNQSGAPQRVTLETDELAGEEPGVARSAGPVAPHAVARLQLDVREGTYALRTADRAIRPATLRVGPRRPSRQHTLLVP